MLMGRGSYSVWTTRDMQGAEHECLTAPQLCHDMNSAPADPRLQLVRHQLLASGWQSPCCACGQADKLQGLLEERGLAFLETYKLPVLTWEESEELKSSAALALDQPGNVHLCLDLSGTCV